MEYVRPYWSDGSVDVVEASSPCTASALVCGGGGRTNDCQECSTRVITLFSQSLPVLHDQEGLRISEDDGQQERYKQESDLSSAPQSD